jgi:hypothetical protein
MSSQTQPEFLFVHVVSLPVAGKGSYQFTASFRFFNFCGSMRKLDSTNVFVEMLSTEYDTCTMFATVGWPVAKSHEALNCALVAHAPGRARITSDGGK